MDSPEFIALLIRHEVRLRAFALSLIPHWADADEVLQEATVVMWRKFDQFEPETNFLSWGFKIIHLVSKDFRKRQSRSRIQFSSDLLSDMLTDAALEAAEELSLRERLLGDCLAKLGEKARTLVQMKYEQGKRAEEISALAEMSVEAVHKAIGRARRALFDCVNRGLRAGQST
jgi:RNA polymerase sigma-70 factor (ECF subfamily)